MRIRPRRLLDPLAALFVTLLPLVLTADFWRQLWHSTLVCSLDGAGHYAIARIYTRTVFPDTFGWTNAYFAGMPFPNFYPPLFFWVVALLSSTGLLTFDVAFKSVLVSSVVLIPAAMWLLAWTLSGRDRAVATGAVLALIPLLVDARVPPPQGPSGLDYLSTFVLGLCTQPLGFVLLASWYAAYVGAHTRRWRFILSSVLLALTLLANFFNAVTAAVFVGSTLAGDALRLYRAAGPDARLAARRKLVADFTSPVISVSLAAFWLVPMLSEYTYFVTRPIKVKSFADTITPAMWAWYLLAELGIVLWLRRHSGRSLPFLASCTILCLVVVLDVAVAPDWFPLQSTRFLATLNVLLAVPLGYVVATFCRVSAESLSKAIASGESGTGPSGLRPQALRALTVACIYIALAVAYLFALERIPFELAFYSPQSATRIEGVLGFARAHREGRYVVEVPTFTPPPLKSLDSRAINSYVGMEGAEALTGVFREASADAIFFNPLVNVFSEHQDNFGISSVLADDLDFVNQPIERHLERLSLVGAKYLVIVSPGIKDRLSGVPGVGAKHDFGDWSIFELTRDAAPRVRALRYKPALVVSDITLKQRRRNEYSFVRLAEEQFADGWYDVLLARSPESKLDRLGDLNGFGALVVDTYRYDDESLAYETLRDFAARHPLILLSCDSPLFSRIKATLQDFPFAEVVERPPAPPGDPINAEVPTLRYGTNPVRKAWGEIRSVLERHKLPIADQDARILSGTADPQNIQINPAAAPSDSLPVIIATTFHPNWRREDGGKIYAATPFYMLTFVRQATRIVYERRWHDTLALWYSALTLISLCVFALRKT